MIVDIDTFKHSTRVIPKSRSCTFLLPGFVIVVQIYHLSTPGTASRLLQFRQDGPHCIFNIVVQIPIYICRNIMLLVNALRYYFYPSVLSPSAA